MRRLLFRMNRDHFSQRLKIRDRAFKEQNGETACVSTDSADGVSRGYSWTTPRGSGLPRCHQRRQRVRTVLTLFEVSSSRRCLGNQPRASDQRERRPRKTGQNRLCPEGALEVIESSGAPSGHTTDGPYFPGRRSLSLAGPGLISKNPLGKSQNAQLQNSRFG